MPAQSLIRSNIVFGFGAVRSSRTASRASKFEGEISVIATPWLERGIETQPMDAFNGGVRVGGGRSWRGDPGVELFGKSHMATVAKEAAHRGEHERSRKTIARGKPA